MLKPTNDPLSVQRRQSIEEERRLRAALDAGGTEPFQAVRKLQAQIAALEQLVHAIPVTVARQTVTSGWTPTGSWQTVASGTIARPVGKDGVDMLALAVVTAPWVSNGLKWPVVSARMLINGVPGPPVITTSRVSAGDDSLEATSSGVCAQALDGSGTSDVTYALQVAITGWVVDEPGGSISFSGTIAQAFATATFKLVE